VFSTNLFNKVSLDSEQLYIKATNQPRLRIFAKSRTEFFLKIANADLEFVLPEEDNEITLILIQNNQILKGKNMLNNIF